MFRHHLLLLCIGYHRRAKQTRLNELPATYLFELLCWHFRLALWKKKFHYSFLRTKCRLQAHLQSPIHHLKAWQLKWLLAQILQPLYHFQQCSRLRLARLYYKLLALVLLRNKPQEKHPTNKASNLKMLLIEFFSYFLLVYYISSL